MIKSILRKFSGLMEDLSARAGVWAYKSLALVDRKEAEKKFEKPYDTVPESYSNASPDTRLEWREFMSEVIRMSVMLEGYTNQAMSRHIVKTMRGIEIDKGVKIGDFLDLMKKISVLTKQQWFWDTMIPELEKNYGESGAKNDEAVIKISDTVAKQKIPEFLDPEMKSAKIKDPFAD